METDFQVCFIDGLYLQVKVVLGTLTLQGMMRKALLTRVRQAHLLVNQAFPDKQKGKIMYRREIK